MKDDVYRLSSEEVCRQYGCDMENGLSSEEARKRLERDGFNEFTRKKHTSLAVKFLNQFKSFMILVLIAAAAVSGIVGVMNGEGFTDVIIILAITVVNAIIGVFQETKAEKSLDALEQMSAPHCKVVRDGDVHVIATRELVKGDLVVIGTGDTVPADIRLTETANLKIQEAALTGESVPVEKDSEPIARNAGEEPESAVSVPVGNRSNMAFASCGVTYGHGRGIVTAVGKDTEVGRIASMIQSVPDMKTPMQHKLDRLGKFLAIAAVAICAVMFATGMLYGKDMLSMFMTSVSLAAAAIPEGLPAVSTIVLAIGVQRLAKRNAIVRNLPSVETLGSTTVICSDKTGTLTQNRMTVTSIYSCGSVRTLPGFAGAAGTELAAGERTESTLSPAEKLLIRSAVLANDTEISGEEGSEQTLGDPTETALADLGLKFGIDKEELDKSLPRVAEIPFDSQRKLMTTVHRLPEGGFLVAAKGGLDELLECCTRIECIGGTRPLENKDKENAARANLEMAGQALRVLAMGYAHIDSVPEEISPESIEKDLIFLGMTGMIDPPREEAKAAVAKCRAAGIRPVMITGDHLITAEAIAQSLGIMKDGDKALSGDEIGQMTDNQLRKEAEHTSVFARVAPEHKMRIVKAYKQNGNVVAMTGDGVNDAPALKFADIGVAMGITGTDVSKEAADVVLADDNFATIVSAVGEGRRIYDNLMKSIQFMLSTNLGEILVLFIAVLCNLVTPLLPVHILWINLVTDSFPALALSFEPAEQGIMERRPIDPKQGIITRGFSLKVLFQGMLIGGLSLAAYLIGMQSEAATSSAQALATARTMAFATLAFSQMSLIFSIRSGMRNAFCNLFSNKFLWGSVAFVLAAMLVVLLVPGVQALFKVTSLTPVQWIQVAGLSASAMFINEIMKLFAAMSKRLRSGSL
ncbi:MAG: cation-translocating P-type ATPase [Bacteroidales bacterium]|nr:cation-translocating P-type ATPase [Bacteroidales bacterium]